MKKIISLLLALLMLAGTVMSLSAANNEYTDKDKWKVTGESYENSVGKIIDGDINTYWHSYYEAENGVITARHEAPFRITVEFPDRICSSEEFTAIQFTLPKIREILPWLCIQAISQ